MESGIGRVRRALEVLAIEVQMWIFLYPLIGALTACRRGMRLWRGYP